MTVAVPRVAPGAQGTTQHLFGPVSDFLMLGGMSIFLFPVLLLLPGEMLEPTFVIVMLLLSNVINHPHFAVSYRIFYDDFGRKIAGEGYADQTLRYRYLFAGVVVPVLLTLALLAPMTTGTATIMSYGNSVLIFFVGWHYVKQGYGMAMVDAAVKRLFFTAVEKKVLLANAYAAWMTTWMMTNRGSDGSEYLGLPVRTVPISDVVFGTAVAALVMTSVATVALFGLRLGRRQATAWTGTTAYLVSLYLWMVFFNTHPLIVLVVPVMHSLQYLYIVRRYQMNRHEAEPNQRSWRSQYWWSVVLGAAIFWVVPTTLDFTVSYDEAVFGALPFTFAFWVGLNVHHYFLDNVMWRRGNPEVSRHLFSGS